MIYLGLPHSASLTLAHTHTYFPSISSPVFHTPTHGQYAGISEVTHYVFNEGLGGVKLSPPKVIFSSLRIYLKQTVSYMKRCSHFLYDYIILLFSGTEGRSVGGGCSPPHTSLSERKRETATVVNNKHHNLDRGVCPPGI